MEKIGPTKKSSLQIMLLFPVLHIFPSVTQIASCTKQFLFDRIQLILQSSRVTEVTMSSFNDV